jgi:hypothetical protein
MRVYSAYLVLSTVLHQAPFAPSAFLGVEGSRVAQVQAQALVVSNATIAARVSSTIDSFFRPIARSAYNDVSHVW